MRKVVLALACLIMSPVCRGDMITYNFSGEVNHVLWDTGNQVSVGDQIRGTLSYDSNAPWNGVFLLGKYLPATLQYTIGSVTDPVIDESLDGELHRNERLPGLVDFTATGLLHSAQLTNLYMDADRLIDMSRIAGFEAYNLSCDGVTWFRGPVTSAVPEPSTLAVSGVALALLLMYKRFH